MTDRMCRWRPGPPATNAGAGEMVLKLLKELNGYE